MLEVKDFISEIEKKEKVNILIKKLIVMKLFLVIMKIMFLYLLV